MLTKRLGTGFNSSTWDMQTPPQKWIQPLLLMSSSALGVPDPMIAVAVIVRVLLVWLKAFCTLQCTITGCQCAHCQQELPRPSPCPDKLRLQARTALVYPGPPIMA